MIIDKRVTRFLEQHFSLISYLFEAFHEINKYFPNAPIELSILNAFDGMEERLSVEIIVIISPEEALKILNKFRYGWYLKHHDSLVSITVNWR
jgi:hypothetical protein